MVIHFNEQELERFDHFKGGEKYINAKMYFDGKNRILYGELPVGGTIGEHKHETNSEIVYVLEGQGLFIIDGKEEKIHAGECHYCPQGHTHTFINNSDDVIKIFAVIPEQ